LREWRGSSPEDLRRTKAAPTEDWADNDVLDVTSYRDLFRAVAFLNVMNKQHQLVFRGQSRDVQPTPTLLRGEWTSPRDGTFAIAADRAYYFSALDTACGRATRVLLDTGLPRHRPFETYGSNPERRVAPWAVVQHYELWPTPLVDLTSSLRVAATFALGVPDHHGSGYVYVFAMRGVVSDVMRISKRSRFAAVRLSAVCPPTTERPHLQEGLLAGDPSFGLHAEGTSRSSLLDRLVAKFRLVDRRPNDRSTFWDRDFPPHSSSSLLPHDDIRVALVSEMHYGVVNGRLELGADTASK
jgi:hypothetical protein